MGDSLVTTKLEESTKADETKPDDEKVAEVTVENNDNIEENKEKPQIVNGTEAETTENGSPTATINSSEIVPQNETNTEEVKAAAPIVEPPTEAVKTVADCSKIEVKPEIKNDSNTTHTEDENKENNQQEVKMQNDGDSDTTKNIPSPPLPNTPPPSQVMVFALSDTKSSEQEQSIPPTMQLESKTEEIITNEQMPVVESVKENETVKENVDSEIIAVIEKDINEKSLTDETISKGKELNEISEKIEEKTQGEDLNVEKSLSTVEEHKSELCQVDDTSIKNKVEENIESTNETEPTAISLAEDVKNVAIEKPTNENVSETSKEVVKETKNNVNVESPKSDNEVNSEKIAETIALIDVVTENVILDANLDSNEENKSETVKNNEVLVENREIEVIQKSVEGSNASPIEENSIPKDPEISSVIDSQPSLASPSSPVVELSTEEKIEDKIEIIELKPVESESSEDLTSSENKKTDISTDQSDEIEIVESSKANTDEKTPASDEITQAISTENQELSKTESPEPEKLNETAENLQQAIAEPKEMNGFDIGKNVIAEKCVTESSNGHCDGDVTESSLNGGGDSGVSEPITVGGNGEN